VGIAKIAVSAQGRGLLPDVDGLELLWGFALGGKKYAARALTAQFGEAEAED